MKAQQPHQILRLGARFKDDGNTTTSGQAEEPEGSTGQLEGQEGVQKARPVVTDWLAGTCLQSYKARTKLSTEVK